MKKYSILLIVAICIYVQAGAQTIFGPGHHIICYSTHAVDTTVARPHNNAKALIRCAGDTLMAYIRRAKYTIDIALYDYVEDSTWYEGGYVPPIHNAIDSAFARGVKIRWIHNPSDSSKGFVNAITPNYGLALINKAIPTLPRTDNSYIMHNKFVIIDGTASNPNDPILWTGCMNWEPGQICKDINNIIIFQDAGLAKHYLTEFNQMWGDTVEGGLPNASAALFGAKKKASTNNTMYIDGHMVENYFSPKDSVSNHIIATQTSAQSEIDFEMFTFTYTADANEMVTKSQHGLAVRGIIDQSSNGNTPCVNLSNQLGPDFLIYQGLPGYDQNGICHSKYLLVDPCDYDWNADPKIWTGSHNWSASADQGNDENTVVVHDSSIANQYYQAFHADFEAVSAAAGGEINLTQSCIPLGINEVKNKVDEVTFYPNPATNCLKAIINIPGDNVQYMIYDITGQLILSGKLDARYVNTIGINTLSSGMYLLRVVNGTKEFTGKFIKQ